MTGAQDQPAVRVTYLTKTYGSIRAVDAIDLAVPPGLIYGIIGPSGAGKSTLIRAIVGAIKPSSGEARVFGRVMPDDAIASQIGYMTQVVDDHCRLALSAAERLNDASRYAMMSQ